MKTIALMLQYLPLVLRGVTAVEETMKGAPGESKKQVILDAVAAGAQTAEVAPDQHVKVVSTLIDVVVGALNTSGIFQHVPKNA